MITCKIKASVPTEAEYKAMNAEVWKYTHLLLPYTVDEKGVPQAGLEVASGGACCVPWAWNLDLPPTEYAHYNSNHSPRGPVQLRGSVDRLPLDSDSLHFVSASHILEDYSPDKWPGLLNEWGRVLKHGGYLLILVPDHDLWWEYVKNGGVHNFAHHQPQPKVGDVSKVAKELGWAVVKEHLTECFPGDHSILIVLQKP